MLLLAFYISLGHSLESYASVLLHQNLSIFGIGSTCMSKRHRLSHQIQFIRITINRETATSTAYLLFHNSDRERPLACEV